MRKPTILVFLIVFIFPTLSHATDTSSLLRRIGEYGQEVSRIEASAAPVSLEKLLQQGNGIAADLRRVIEQLSNTEYEYVFKNMKGFIVNRDEVIIVEPDSNFFAKLAQKVGTERDRIYFDFLLKVKPEGYWLAYLIRQTDAGGCTNYGNGDLSRLYKEGRMVSIKDGYYGSQLNELINEMKDEFTSGSCACEDAQSVVKEFGTFMEINPNETIVERVRERLQEIKKGTSNMRFHCVGGI